MQTLFTLSLFLFLGLHSASATLFTGRQDPAQIDPGFSYAAYTLPMKGDLSRKPWSESYWPDNQGSINVRWNQAIPSGFQNPSPGLADLKSMLPTEIAKLSPTEKYDIFQRRYDYPLKNEVAVVANPTHGKWDGICDGWAIASTQYAEPKAFSIKNADGITIPFGSSDIKALMSYAGAYHFRSETKQVGVGCTEDGACTGLNAASLHILLTNLIGKQNRSFIIDRDVSAEVWNQPVFAYDLHFAGSTRPHDGAVSAVRVQGSLSYTDELEQSSMSPVMGTSNEKTVTLNLDYNLDLGPDGNIIGGSFNRRSGTADFAWVPVNHLEFTDYLSGINQIYHPVP